MFDDGLARLGELAVAAGLAGEVDNHAAGFHTLHRSGGHQPGRGATRHQRRGDHHVEATDGLLEFLLLGGPFLLGEFTRISTLTRGVDPNVEPLGTHRPDLIGHLGPDVVPGGAPTQPLGGGQCLQSGHADAEHQHAGRFDRARRGGQHREEAGGFARRKDDGLVSGHVALRGQRIHHLGAGDTRDRLDRERLHTRRLERTDLGVGVARREEADERLAGAKTSHLSRRRRRYLQHDVACPGIADRRTGGRIEIVGQQGGLPGTGFDHHGDAAIDQRRDRLGHQRHPALIGRRLGDDAHSRLGICHELCFCFLGCSGSGPDARDTLTAMAGRGRCPRATIGP